MPEELFSPPAPAAVKDAADAASPKPAAVSSAAVSLAEASPAAMSPAETSPAAISPAAAPAAAETDMPAAPAGISAADAAAAAMPAAACTPAVFPVPATPLTRRRRFAGLPGSTLKLTAIGTMLVDHIGAAVLLPMLMLTGVSTLTSQAEVTAWLARNGTLYWTYTAMRSIGRIAFPIFCFLLTEGYAHTHSKLRYALRLAAFALISEVPFDLAFQHSVLEFTYQNVFFTLLCGLLAVWGLDACLARARACWQAQPAPGAGCVSSAFPAPSAGAGDAPAGAPAAPPADTAADAVPAENAACENSFPPVPAAADAAALPAKKAAARRFWTAAGFAALGVLCAGAGTAAAALLHTDYGAVGVLCVLLFYALHRWRWLAALAAVGALCAMDVSEVFALAAVPLIGLYSGQRGLRLKYVFYAFYPAHLLLLWGIASAMSLI